VKLPALVLEEAMVVRYAKLVAEERRPGKPLALAGRNQQLRENSKEIQNAFNERASDICAMKVKSLIATHADNLMRLVGRLTSAGFRVHRRR